MAQANTITLLFTDLVGSTAMGDKIGDDAAEKVRRRFFQIIEEAVGPTGGRIVKTLGDGHMVAFASALDAVGCAVAIQAGIDTYNSDPGTEPIGVRVGINAGDVAIEGDDYFGTPVTIAKRLCDSAEGGQILVSGLVESLVGSRGSFAFRTLGARELRGLSRPQATVEVVWRPDADELAETTHQQAVNPSRNRSAARRRGRWALIPAASVVVGSVVAGVVAWDRRDTEPAPPRNADIVSGNILVDTAGELPRADSVRTHSFRARAGDTVRIEAVRRALDVDLVIELRAPDHSLLQFDDDSGAGSEPLIASTRLPRSGRYEVDVRMFAPDTNGGYRLKVTKVTGTPDASADRWFDEITETGEHVEIPVDLTEGDQIDIAVRAESVNLIDLYLELIDPTGTVAARDDDSGEYNDPIIEKFTVSTTGTWTIRLRAVEPEDLGAFRVDVRRT